MTSSDQLEFLVTAEHHNVPVVVERAATRAEAESLAERMRRVADTIVTIEQVRGTGPVSLETRIRERSEEIGWRNGDRTRSVGND